LNCPLALKRYKKDETKNLMTYYKKLIGEKCYLSPCQVEDAEKWTAWFNDLDVAIPLGDEAYTLISLEKSQKNVKNMIKEHQHVFSIVDNEKDALIGRCLLFGLDEVNRKAMLGIVIGEKEFWGKGYGQDATKLLLEYAFNLLNLNSVMLGVMAFNERAVHCYQKVGFKEVGRRREARIIGKQRYDVILMDILAEEFLSKNMSQILHQ
jgi:RimJ/RimL family protein N-acetyltransferase